MYTINEINIEGSKIVANVTITMADKSELVVNVPVKAATKEDVLVAIQYRAKLEQAKYAAAPLLNAIKSELEVGIVGKAQAVK